MDTVTEAGMAIAMAVSTMRCAGKSWGLISLPQRHTAMPLILVTFPVVCLFYSLQVALASSTTTVPLNSRLMKSGK